jgi:DNA-binding transcriptional regulator YdaS (Cro superfamily)
MAKRTASKCRVIAVEAATGIDREDLRPDLYPPRREG